MRVLIGFLMAGAGLAANAAVFELTTDQKAVWQLEEAYWRYVKTGDVDDYGDGTSSGKGLWRKFVHAWKKSGDSWQIITGMCAAQEPVNAPRS